MKVTGLADKGMAVGRNEEGQVVFLTDVVPGDTVDALLLRKKKGVWRGVPQQFVEYSNDRVEEKCQHFQDCGGCKWQHFAYDAQLREKETIVRDAMQRIAQVEIEEFRPILGSSKIFGYRNKMEYSFSNRRWKTKDEIREDNILESTGALGLHPPGFFDKVVNITTCWLQEEPSNAIRNFVREYAEKHQLAFFDPVNHKGFLRNMILRNNRKGEWMLVISFYEDRPQLIESLLTAIIDKFPAIVSVFYVVNQKKNDTLFDQEFIHFFGNSSLQETLGDVEYQIRPKSFFQTNTYQAETLYKVAKDMAALRGSEMVYDLYTGIGSIAAYVADQCRAVVGIEEVEDAILDARENAEANGIENAHFYAGDVRRVFTQDLMERHGRPDVVITDPPRGGMHEDVTRAILDMNPKTIIYISCNPATQARDIKILSASYEVKTMQPVDMFPHTNHIENVAKLVRK